MQRLNAIDAIAPAFTRTHETIFQPFKLGRTWKLCASSYLAVCGSVFVPLPVFFGLMPWHGGRGTGFAAVLLGVLTALWLGFFYLGARMGLVNFEMLVTRAKFIAPMWRHYGAKVWPMIGLKVLVGTALTAVMAPILLTRGRMFFATMGEMPRYTHGADMPAFQMQMQAWSHHMAAINVVLYGYLLILLFFSTLINDFVLPFFVLEEIPITAALSRGLDVVLADPLHVIGYLVMKLVLAVIGFIFQYIANLVALIPVMLVFGIAIMIGTLVPGKLMGVAEAVLFMALFAAVLYTTIGSFGYLMTLLEAYSIYFVGGRYPLLGDLLEPPAPAPFRYTPPPSFPSTEERKDEDDSGPNFPLDPAVA